MTATSTLQPTKSHGSVGLLHAGLLSCLEEFSLSFIFLLPVILGDFISVKILGALRDMLDVLNQAPSCGGEFLVSLVQGGETSVSLVLFGLRGGW